MYYHKFMNNYGQLIDQLQDYLEFQREEGFQTVEISLETLALLKPAAAKKEPEKKAAPHRPLPVPEAPAAPPPPAPESVGVQVTGKTIEDIAKQISTCTACPLHASRSQTVPGEGTPNQPDILFIGEGPGPEEDQSGRPFVDEAGQLLDKMIVAMGYKRENVFITTVSKCMPPDERIPRPEERAACMPYLEAQVELIQPKVIVALGKAACESLLGKPVAITRARGTWETFKGIDMMQTFHPGYLVKVPAKKGDVWADLKAVLTQLGKEPPARN